MLTKKQALLETYKLWSLIASTNPPMSKYEAVASNPEIAHITYYEATCPCCEYALRQQEANRNPDGSYSDMCSFCPLLSLWPEKCTSLGTPYSIYRGRNIEPERARAAAQQIADAALAEYNKLTEE